MTALSLTALAAGSLEGIALLGCMQAVAGVAMLDRFRNRAGRLGQVRSPDTNLPAVTVLKPLHGNEPLLAEALRGFIEQDYPVHQIVFGVQDPLDSAIALVRSLCSEYPTRDLCLVVDATEHGANRKVGNLINMLPHARHDLLVISDSDIHVAPDYLRRIAQCFANDRKVGLVTSLYHGIPASPSMTRRFAAGQINHNFLPGVLLSRLLGRQDCLGSTMALHRDTLSLLGGLAMLCNHVADDQMLGVLVRALGRSIAIAPSLTATTIGEAGPRDLFEHELRWGRTVRAVEPLGYALSSIQFPLFWAGLACLLAAGAGWSIALFFAIWVLRAAIATRVDGLITALGQRPLPRSPGRKTMPALLLPMRDWFSALVMAASFSGSRVNWRGQVLRVSGWSRTPSTARTSLSLSHCGRAPRSMLAHAHQTLVQGD